VADFSRALHYAGARGVIVNLWDAAPKDTITYMKNFYRYIREGKTTMEALILIRRDIRSQHPHPFYWASFILHGERH
jgi:CHAT domain-containing protein